MSDKEDGEVLSEGELEDGELPSSDEEEDTAKDKEPLKPQKSPPSLQAESEQHHAAQKRPLPEEEAGAAEKLTPEQKVVSVINFLTINFVTSHRITSSTFAAILSSLWPYLVVSMLLNLASSMCLHKHISQIPNLLPYCHSDLWCLRLVMYTAYPIMRISSYHP